MGGFCWFSLVFMLVLVYCTHLLVRFMCWGAVVLAFWCLVLVSLLVCGCWSGYSRVGGTHVLALVLMCRRVGASTRVLVMAILCWCWVFMCWCGALAGPQLVLGMSFEGIPSLFKNESGKQRDYVKIAGSGVYPPTHECKHRTDSSHLRCIEMTWKKKIIG